MGTSAIKQGRFSMIFGQDNHVSSRPAGNHYLYPTQIETLKHLSEVTPVTPKTINEIVVEDFKAGKDIETIARTKAMTVDEVRAIVGQTPEYIQGYQAIMGIISKPKEEEYEMAEKQKVKSEDAVIYTAKAEEVAPTAPPEVVQPVANKYKDILVMSYSGNHKMASRMLDGLSYELSEMVGKEVVIEIFIKELQN